MQACAVDQLRNDCLDRQPIAARGGDCLGRAEYGAAASSAASSPASRRTKGSSAAISTPADGHGRLLVVTKGIAARIAPMPNPTSIAANPAW